MSMWQLGCVLVGCLVSWMGGWVGGWREGCGYVVVVVFFLLAVVVVMVQRRCAQRSRHGVGPCSKQTIPMPCMPCPRRERAHTAPQSWDASRQPPTFPPPPSRANAQIKVRAYGPKFSDLARSIYKYYS